MDSLSAQLLTDPYTALHDASAQAVADARSDVRALVRDVLAHSPDPGHDTNTAAGREAITLLIGEALAPLIARYAHAITGVRTLRALLNAGSLEFSAAGTVKRCTELLHEVAALSGAETLADLTTGEVGSQAIVLGENAAHLLAELETPDQQPAEEIVAGDVLADQEVDTQQANLFDLHHLARQHADVLAGDEAITVAVDAPNNPGEDDADPDQADADDDAVNALSAEEGRRRKEAAAEIKRGRAAVSYLAPFYEVYRADTGRQPPHCTTPTYDSALSYCRASHGTPWHILEIDDQGEALLVTDVKIDGTVVELTDRLPPFHVADPAPEDRWAEANAVAARDRADKAAGVPLTGTPEREKYDREAGVWFTVRRGDDPAGGDFCRTPHYAIALEYCQGSPGAPWAIWQTVNGDTGSVIVTTVDEAGDVTEVGERGTL